MSQPVNFARAYQPQIAQIFTESICSHRCNLWQKKLNRIPNAQECDATEAEQNYKSRVHKKIKCKTNQ